MIKLRCMWCGAKDFVRSFALRSDFMGEYCQRCDSWTMYPHADHVHQRYGMAS